MADYDILIQGGIVIDGTTLPRYRADVAIKDGRIAKIGNIKTASAAKVLDVGGCIVAPGYVDIHTHFDAQILWDPYCTISGWHGATSVVLGNCGFGFAPVRPEERDRTMLSMTRNEAIDFNTMKEGMQWEKFGWITMQDWVNHLDRTPKGVNCTTLVPLNPLYAWAMGGYEEAKKRRPTNSEMAAMKQILNEAMDHGACGFSYQRQGIPSVQPDWDGSPMISDLIPDRELLEFGKVLGERGQGCIETFDADSSDYGSVEEFLTKLTEVSNRPILRNILVPNDEEPAVHEKFLAWLDENNERGLEVYGLGMTVRGPMVFTFEDWSLYDGSPFWHDVMNGQFAERASKMRNEEIRKGLRHEMDTRATFNMRLGSRTSLVRHETNHPSLITPVPDICRHLNKLTNCSRSLNGIHCFHIQNNRSPILHLSGYLFLL